MSLLSRLFGGGVKKDDTPPEDYHGFRITPDPMPVDGQYRLAARVETNVDGKILTHHLIRADLFRDKKAAAEASVDKARMLIDQQGVRLFN